MADKLTISQIAASFDANIHALRAFTNRIGTLADEQDKEAMESLLQTFEHLFGVNFGSPTETTFDTPSNTNGVDTFNSQEIADEQEEKEKIMVRQAKALAEAFVKKLKDPAQGPKILETLQNIKRNSPFYGFLLRRGALVNLASIFETLIADLVRIYYNKYPLAMPAESKSLSLLDLREIGSIEEAETYLINKEIDSLLRESLETQLEFFSKRLKLDLEALKSYQEELIEMSQRRNLFVHNNGITNKIYITKAPKSIIQKENIKEGEQLDISRDYLDTAIDSVYLSGVILIQQCWRKWNKEEIEEAESILVISIYEVLREERYELTKRMSRSALILGFSKDEASRIILINQAIALRALGETEEMKKLLSGLDWSSCALKFKIALYALLDENDKLINNLPKAIAAGEISRDALEQWPLFKGIRQTEAFIQILTSCTFPDEMNTNDGTPFNS